MAKPDDAPKTTGTWQVALPVVNDQTLSLASALLAKSFTPKVPERTVAGLKMTLVDDVARACAVKTVTTRQKIGIAQAQCRGDQAAHTDRSPGPKQHALRVDQKDLTVGSQTALDHRRLWPQHAVKRQRVPVGLNKTHRFTGQDAKALPIEHHLGRGLGNRQLPRRAAQNGLACTDHAPAGRGQAQA